MKKKFKLLLLTCITFMYVNTYAQIGMNSDAIKLKVKNWYANDNSSNLYDEKNDKKTGKTSEYIYCNKWYYNSNAGMYLDPTAGRAPTGYDKFWTVCNRFIIENEKCTRVLHEVADITIDNLKKIYDSYSDLYQIKDFYFDGDFNNYYKLYFSEERGTCIMEYFKTDMAKLPADIKKVIDLRSKSWDLKEINKPIYDSLQIVIFNYFLNNCKSGLGELKYSIERTLNGYVRTDGIHKSYIEGTYAKCNGKMVSYNGEMVPWIATYTYKYKYERSLNLIYKIKKGILEPDPNCANFAKIDSDIKPQLDTELNKVKDELKGTPEIKLSYLALNGGKPYILEFSYLNKSGKRIYVNPQQPK